MKKYTYYIPFIILILFGVIFTFLYFINNDYMSDVNKSLNNDINSLKVYLNKYNYDNQGTLDVVAKYKGAHGEAYPSDYSYSFFMNDNKLDIIDVSNYVSFELNKDFIDLIDKLSKVTFEDVDVKVNTEGLFNRVSSVEVIYDDIKVIKKDNNYNIVYKDNVINININKLGYLLTINDSFKMNAFIKSDNDTYSVVINDYAFYVEMRKNNILIKANSPSAIYNGLEVNVSFNKINEYKNKKIDNSVSNPIKRYVDSANLSVWRK